MLTSDWLLLGLMGQLDAAKALPICTVLEHGCVAKPDQVLRRRADLDQQQQDGTWWRCWTRLGRGIFPMEYWVTDDGRVPMVTAGNRWWALRELEVLS